MSVISQQLAKDISRSISNHKLQEIEKLEHAFVEEVFDNYFYQTPALVGEVFEKYPDYFQTVNSVTLKGNGFNWEDVESLNRRVLPNTGDRAFLDLSNKSLSNSLVKQSSKITDMKREYNELVKSIQIALLSCRTSKRAIEAFPECAPFFNSPIQRGLIVNFSDIRKKLK